MAKKVVSREINTLWLNGAAVWREMRGLGTQQMSPALFVLITAAI